MVKYWVPLAKPPHPSDISGISPFAESIIQTLRQEAYKKKENLKMLRPQRQYDWCDNTQSQMQPIQLEFNGAQINTESPSNISSSDCIARNRVLNESFIFDQNNGCDFSNQHTFNRSLYYGGNRFCNQRSGGLNVSSQTHFDLSTNQCIIGHNTYNDRTEGDFNSQSQYSFGSKFPIEPSKNIHGSSYDLLKEGNENGRDCFQFNESYIEGEKEYSIKGNRSEISEVGKTTYPAFGFNKPFITPSNPDGCGAKEVAEDILSCSSQLTVLSSYSGGQTFDNGFKSHIPLRNNQHPTVGSTFDRGTSGVARTKKNMIQSRVNNSFQIKKNYNESARRNCSTLNEKEPNQINNDKVKKKLNMSIEESNLLPLNTKALQRVEKITSKARSKLEMFKAGKMLHSDIPKGNEKNLVSEEEKVDENLVFAEEDLLFDSEIDRELMEAAGITDMGQDNSPRKNEEICLKNLEQIIEGDSVSINNKISLECSKEQIYIDQNESKIEREKEGNVGLVGRAETIPNEIISKHTNYENPNGSLKKQPECKETKDKRYGQDVGSHESTKGQLMATFNKEIDNTAKQAIKRKVSPLRETEHVLFNNSASSKRIKFQAPLKKKLIQTKLYDKSKLSEVIDLNKCSLRDLESQMNYCTPMEIAFTIQFSNGSTQLSNPENSGAYKAILLRIMWQRDNVEICSIAAELWKTEKAIVKDFFRTVLKIKSALICVESAEFMLFLIQKFKYDRDLTLNWKILDPLIAFWLLKPDDPCNTFSSLTEALQMKNLDVKKPRSQVCSQLDLLSECFKILKERLTEENLWYIYYDMEVKLTPILARMSQRGLQVNESHLREIGSMIGQRLVTLEGEAQKLAGSPFLVTSPVQLRRVLFDNLKLDQSISGQVKGTTLGVKSTSEVVLKQLAHLHPLPNIILEHRRLHKLKTTFVDGILSFVKKGAVHTVWEQRSAATGRLASSNPNLQSIPKQWITITSASNQNTQLNIRSAFLPRKGYKFLLADFQQIEFRIFAHLTQDPTLVEMFLKSDDVFITLAQRWLASDGNEVTPVDREKTKRIVYSVLYGAGPSKLAEFLNIPHQEAVTLFNTFCACFPIMKKFSKQVAEQCVADGKLCTVMGRYRKFEKINDTNGTLKAQAERQALNFLIQGAAADICKQAMLQCENEIIKSSPPLDGHLVLQIHDELIWEVSENDLLQFKGNLSFCFLMPLVIGSASFPECPKELLASIVLASPELRPRRNDNDKQVWEEVLVGIVKEKMENCQALDGTLLNLTVPIKVRITEQSNWAPEDKTKECFNLI